MPGETKAPKILMIEDDIFMIDLLMGEFKKAGFDVTLAKTGPEGVAKFAEIKPDLILLDLILPGLHGFDALRQIRRKPGGPETKVMILSNLAEGADMEEAKRLGVVDYLVKANFSLEEVVDKVRKAVEKK